MTKWILWCCVLLLPITSMAGHVSGGDIHYTLVKQSNGIFTYNVTLTLYRLCNSGREINNSTVVSFFDRVTNGRVMNVTVPLGLKRTISFRSRDPCITNPPTVCYEVGIFDFTVDLPASVNGYLVSSQVIFRVNNINNLRPGYGNIGAAYTAEIPGTINGATAPANNSAEFTGSDLVLLCADNSFTYGFNGRDADNDQLRYRFCPALQSGPGVDAENQRPPSAPPYDTVPYGNGYVSAAPFGTRANINPATGFITGIAPPAGVYIISVCIDEVRNGKVIATQRKDIQVRVTNCKVANATLQPLYLLCNDTNDLQLNNLSTSPLINSFNWQVYNAAGSNVFSSTLSMPSITFADTGVYRVQLFINQNQPCSDSTTTQVRVYPGTQANFDNIGLCVKAPVQFTNRATTRYGTITQWLYNFGNDGEADTSNLPNPSFQYVQTGNKVVTQTITTSTGCSSSFQKTIVLNNNPAIALQFADTLICRGDTLQLKANSPGNYSWQLNTTLLNANTNQPTVFPLVTTRYVVQYNENGCTNTDSVLVRVVDSVSLSTIPDTIICRGDVVTLKATSNALQYEWLPAALFSNNLLPMPSAAINQSTLFTLKARIGGCSAARSFTILTIPYPTANAGSDTTICFNTSAVINASIGGSSYAWLRQPSITQPLALTGTVRPGATNTYVLAAFDTLGCPKPFYDSVTVRVLPKLAAFAGNDTSVVANQPLQLNAMGGTSYAWSPGRFLSAANTNNPVAVFPPNVGSVRYRVTVLNSAGCSDTASMTVKIFDTKPGVFVPTAFTPNADGRNDVLRPIIAGLQQIEFFSVFNRWGQRVFHTQAAGPGWNGTINGLPQASGTFVWMFKAKDFTGKPYFEKGVVTLIR